MIARKNGISAALLSLLVLQVLVIHGAVMPECLAHDGPTDSHVASAEEASAADMGGHGHAEHESSDDDSEGCACENLCRYMVGLTLAMDTAHPAFEALVGQSVAAYHAADQSVAVRPTAYLFPPSIPPPASL